MSKCPCRGCPDRTITCHGVCRKYQEWKAEHEKALEEMRKQRSATSEGWTRAHHERVRRKARGWDRKPRDYD